MSIRRTGYNLLARLHDLWILLAWAGVLAAVMLNTFYHRDCFQFTTVLDLTAPCQSGLDLGLIFLAAVGAGIAFADDRMGILGFLPAHVLGTISFVIILMIPSMLGLTDQVLASIILSRVLVVALKSTFPFPLFLSFLGGLIGLYFGGKLPIEGEV